MTWLERFQNELSPFEQKFVEYSALAYAPISQTKLMNLLDSMGIQTDEGKRPYSPVMGRTKEKLLQWGFLVYTDEPYFTCKDELKHQLLTQASKAPYFHEVLDLIRRFYPVRGWGFGPVSWELCQREITYAILTKDIDSFDQYIYEAHVYFPQNVKSANLYLDYFSSPFDPDYLREFPLSFQVRVLEELVLSSLYMWENPEEYLAYMQEHASPRTPDGIQFLDLMFTVYLFRGNMEKAQEILTLIPEELFLAFVNQAALWFMAGDMEMAIKTYEQGLRMYRKLDGSRRTDYIDHFNSLFYALALLSTRESKRLKKLQKVIKYFEGTSLHVPMIYVQAALYGVQNHMNAAREYANYRPNNARDQWLQALVIGWYGNSLRIPYEFSEVRQQYDQATEHGYKWVQRELAHLLLQWEPESAFRQSLIETTQTLDSTLPGQALLHLLPRMEDWERVLKALENVTVAKKGSNVKQGEKQYRLVWLVNFQRRHIQPKEQTLGKNGKWSKGRNIALKRLKEGGIAHLTEQDLQIVKTLKRDRSYGYYYGVDEYYFDYDKAFKAMVGHPLLFLADSPHVSVELTQVELELILEEQGEQLVLRLSEEASQPEIRIIKETPTRYQLLEITERHVNIFSTMGGGMLQIPRKAQKRVLEVVEHLAGVVPVHSELGLKESDIPKIEGDPRIFVQLLPIGDQIKLELLVKPFTTAPPYFKPAHGRENVLATLDGERKLALRDFNQERNKLKELLESCPLLAQSLDEEYECLLEEAEDCLQVLVELGPLREAEQVVVEWPRGEKFRVSYQADSDQLFLNIRKKSDWFALEGELKLNEKEVVKMEELLQKVEASSSEFIELSDGSYLALTRSLRKRLQELAAYTLTQKEGLQLHPLAAGALEEFTSQVASLKADNAWKKHIARLQEAQQQSFEVPSTFKAELRTYQEEGFQWMQRLAYWGVGACLADDMGLGKTVQALAVLLQRAEHGPALVVAPTSVTRNWIREAQKFTPTLRPLIFGQGNRKEMMEELAPFDLLVCSYGLLQTENELLAQQTFSTIILDEAQAIKNRTTKRSQAAMKMKGAFKVITTGTPVENHLGELWNLFQFINPGLLGGAQQFQERFAIPIEKNKDKDRQQQLKKLLQPFILRRRKSEVLEELPPKTEVVLEVELSAEEMAFYEALRRQAVDSLEPSPEEGEGVNRMRILAEIMRLRQACCNIRLLDPNSTVSSAKLTLFGETLTELLENKHKVLVFSQFVGHLKLIEAYIQEHNIDYQYLDGQTPPKQREARIQAFQKGIGDVFLISLKAGGVGLNLTAADYVIHMDPWWNPAVEDQASDRAHRIGQQRPVTVYRLIASGTIEEKIIRLHEHKRDLADSLLMGTDSSGKLSAEELLNLIKAEKEEQVSQ